MQIEEYEERLRVAMLYSNVAELEVLIDDDLVFVGPGGGIYTKADDLQLHRSGRNACLKRTGMRWKCVRTVRHASPW